MVQNSNWGPSNVTSWIFLQTVKGYLLDQESVNRCSLGCSTWPILYFYRPQRSCGKVMFLHSLSFYLQGGVCHSPGRHPPGQTPPGRHPRPPGQTPPPSACWDTHTPMHSACWDTVNKRAVCILLECILVECITTRPLSANVSDVKFIRQYLKSICNKSVVTPALTYILMICIFFVRHKFIFCFLFVV